MYSLGLGIKTVWRRFAILCYNNGDLKKTKQAYKNVLQLDPSDFNSRKNLGNIYQQEEKYKKTIRMYEQALSFNKEDLLLIKELILLYIKIGEREKQKN